MVSVDNFFVFGGGRWRGVDTGSGLVEGWGRAKFVVSRGGKLHAVRSRPVLSALRALAEARPSAARAGLPLEYKYLPTASKERVKGGCKHCKCCHLTGNSNSNTTVLTRPLDLPRVPSKRKRGSTSTEDLSPVHKITTSATVHSYKKPKPKRRRETTNSHESAKSCKESSSDDKHEQSDKVGLKRKRQTSCSSEGILETPLKSRVRSLKLRKPGPLNRKRGARESPVPKSNKTSDEIRQNKMSKYLQPKAKKMRKGSSSDEGVRQTTRQGVSIVLSSNDSDFDVDKRELMTRRRPKSSIEVPLNVVDKKNDETSSDEAPRRKSGSKRTMERSTKNKNSKKVVAKSFTGPIVKNNVDAKEKPLTQPTKRKIGPNSAMEKAKVLNDCGVVVDRSSVEEIHRTGPKRAVKLVKNKRNPVENQSETRSQDRKSSETSKELIIDEQDVLILRMFLQKHYRDEELLRFDTDDEYKKMHFYQINPLVSIERCPRIARMIREDSQDSQITLEDFASKLGLKSISEASAETKRYKTRKRVDKSDVVETDSDKDKENFNQLSRTKNAVTEKALKESANKDLVKEKKIENNRGTNKTVEISELSSDEGEQKKKKLPEIKTPRFRKMKSAFPAKRGGLNEYSNLEDHAIVSWVSVGGRASCVNGNRIWRELQDQFHSITGHGRTWHSLRNRYLRYILPRLDALALPPAQQSRLRAAAAAGEMKSRRADPRRNSIFKLPPRGASSRRPKPPDTPGGDNQNTNLQHTGKSPPNTRFRFSPRYSDVIRQFTRSHRVHSSDRSGSKDSQTNSRKLSPDEERNKPDKSKRKSLNLSSRRMPSVSTERKPRHNSPILSNGRNTRRKSSSSELKLQSPETSDTENSSAFNESRNNHSDRYSKRRAVSTDSSSDSSAPKSSDTRKSNRHRSPSGENRRKSNRHRSPSVENRRKSNRHRSPSGENRRKSNRHKSPSESKSPSRSNKSSYKSREKSPSESNRHKLPVSNQRKSNRHKSPEQVKRQSIREDKNTIDSRKNNQSHSSPTRLLRSNSPVKPRTRKLFNPSALL